MILFINHAALTKGEYYNDKSPLSTIFPLIHHHLFSLPSFLFQLCLLLCSLSYTRILLSPHFSHFALILLFLFTFFLSSLHFIFFTPSFSLFSFLLPSLSVISNFLNSFSYFFFFILFINYDIHSLPLLLTFVLLPDSTRDSKQHPLPAR